MGRYTGAWGKLAVAAGPVPANQGWGLAADAAEAAKVVAGALALVATLMLRVFMTWPC